MITLLSWTIFISITACITISGLLILGEIFAYRREQGIPLLSLHHRHHDMEADVIVTRAAASVMVSPALWHLVIGQE